MEVEVRGSVDQALRVLKRKLLKDGVFKALKRHTHYLKPSDRRKLKRAASRKRRAKIERQQLQS